MRTYMGPGSYRSHHRNLSFFIMGRMNCQTGWKGRYVDEMELADAVERAIQECISEGVLKDFLEKHRAEAKEMSIFEYDQEKHMRQEREAAWEDGLNNGIMLTKQVLQLSARGKSIEEITRECSISAEQVKRILE